MNKKFKTEFQRLIWWLLVATRGGSMRVKILSAIKESPANANRISEKLNVNYRTVDHHLKILAENNIVICEGSGYGKVYYLSPMLMDNENMLNDIVDQKPERGE